MTGSIREKLAVIDRLAQSDSERCRRVARNLRSVFGSSRRKPPDRILDQQEEIERHVSAFFPTPFAARYQRWRERVREFYVSMGDNDTGEILKRYELALGEMIRLIASIIKFLPCVMVPTLRRYAFQDIESAAPRELRDVILKYQDVYGNPAVSDGAYIALVGALHRLFSRLDQQKALDDRFILYPLLRNPERPFDEFIPRRLLVLLESLGRIRNDTIHRDFFTALKDSNDITRVFELLEWCFLDTIDIVDSLCRSFVIICVTDLSARSGKITGWGLDGLGDRGKRYFRVSRVDQPDGEAIRVDDAYLIRRSSEVSRGNEILAASDYVRISPFVICHLAKEGSDGRGAQWELLLLDFYDNVARELRFVGLGESEERTLAMPPLLEQYEMFLDTFVRVLAAAGTARVRQVSGDESRGEFLHGLRRRAWVCSSGMVGSLLDVNAYDESGGCDRRRLSQVLTRKYDERVFVEPPCFPRIREFIGKGHGRRGLFLSGASGIGKSNVLCHAYLEMLRCVSAQGELPKIGVFVDARRISERTFAEYAEGRLLEELRVTKEALWGADGNGQCCELILFLDAINEYNTGWGPTEFLWSIVQYLERGDVCLPLRVIASFREETWQNLTRLARREEGLLSADVFLSDAGRPLVVRGFETMGEKARLYRAYALFHGLVPECAEGLTEEMLRLIRDPFVLSLIAEIYSNQVSAEGRRRGGRVIRVPKRLDYYRLFGELTSRKIRDGSRMAEGSGEAPELLERDLGDCLKSFTEVLFRKIGPGVHLAGECGVTADESDTLDQTDSVPMRLMTRSEGFERFLRKSDYHVELSCFAILRQSGLIQEVLTTELNAWGVRVPGRAYKFFHDRFTEFQLSLHYARGYLPNPFRGRKQLPADELERVAERVAGIVRMGRDQAVLAGALDHWLFASMSDRSGRMREPLLPLFERLAREPSATMRTFLARFLTSLPERGVMDDDDLCEAYVGGGTLELKKVVSGHLAFLWPDIRPEFLRALLGHLDVPVGEDDFRDDEIFRELADICAEIFAREPDRICRLLMESVKGFERLDFVGLLSAAVRMEEFKRHLHFFAKFLAKATLDNFRDESRMRIIGGLLSDRFGVILDAILKPGSGGIIRTILARTMEANGINQWDEAIGAQGENNSFFVEQAGVRQRDKLRDFYPYVVAFHNGDMEALSLEPRSEFRRLTIEMIRYRSHSIIGYVASLVLAGVLAVGDARHVRLVMGEILERPNDATLFFAQVILGAIGKMAPNRVAVALDVAEKDLVPRLLAADIVDDRLLGFVFLAAGDLVKLWPASSGRLLWLIDRLVEKRDGALIDQFGDALRRLVFYPSEELPRLVVRDLLLARVHERSELWARAIRAPLAALLARDPAGFEELAEHHGLDARYVSAIRDSLNAELVRMKDEVSYQFAWNELFVYSLGSLKRARYVIVRSLLAGLVQSNSVPEFAKEFRRFVFDSVEAFFSDRLEAKSPDFRIEVEEALENAEARARYGEDGMLWFARKQLGV